MVHDHELKRTFGERLRDQGELAAGAQGVIKRVYDANLLRTVAMKLLAPELSTFPEHRNRFLGEAQVTGQLDHPNITPVHEVGLTPEGGLYFTMKLVGGQSLEQVLSSSEFGPNDDEALFNVLQAFVKVCHAVSFAHSKSVIHRDLKPENIMLGAHGEVYVMDWGLALIEDMEAEHSVDSTWNDTTDDILGTPEYMAPEQAQGLIDRIDERTDVFCLGAILYRILAGRPPYREPLPMLAVIKASQVDYLPIEQVAPEPVPLRLADISRKAMQEDPALRYGSVAALRLDVESFMRGSARLPTRTFQPGELIIRENDAPDNAYIIQSGRVSVFKTVNGYRRNLVELGPGKVFGEAAIFSSQPRTASVDAVTEVEATVVSVDLFRRETGGNAWLPHLVSSLADRFRALDSRCVELGAELDAARVERELLAHAAFRGNRRENELWLPWDESVQMLAHRTHLPVELLAEHISRIQRVDRRGDMLVIRATE